MSTCVQRLSRKRGRPAETHQAPTAIAAAWGLASRFSWTSCQGVVALVAVAWSVLEVKRAAYGRASLNAEGLVPCHRAPKTTRLAGPWLVIERAWKIVCKPRTLIDKVKPTAVRVRVRQVRTTTFRPTGAFRSTGG